MTWPGSQRQPGSELRFKLRFLNAWYVWFTGKVDIKLGMKNLEDSQNIQVWSMCLWHLPTLLNVLPDSYQSHDTDQTTGLGFYKDSWDLPARWATAPRVGTSSFLCLLWSLLLRTSLILKTFLPSMLHILARQRTEVFFPRLQDNKTSKPSLLVVGVTYYSPVGATLVVSLALVSLCVRVSFLPVSKKFVKTK